MAYNSKIRFIIDVTVAGDQSKPAGHSTLFEKYFKPKDIKDAVVLDAEVEVTKIKPKVDEEQRELNILKKIVRKALGEDEPLIGYKDGPAVFLKSRKPSTFIKLTQEMLTLHRTTRPIWRNKKLIKPLKGFRLADPDCFNNLKSYIECSTKRTK